MSVLLYVSVVVCVSVGITCVSSSRSAYRVSHLVGAMSSSSRVSPGIGAERAWMVLALSWILSLRLDWYSELVLISVGAMPCSPKSYTTDDGPEVPSAWT